jgi:cation transport regulator ChaC
VTDSVRTVSAAWVFGYGSLVSPSSFGGTLGRTLRPGIDVHEADLAGYGRRWNYGVTSATGETVDDDGSTRAWTIVALGVVASERETTNGVVVRVDAAELELLDRRERLYDRVEVTSLATVHADVEIDAPVVTYVPRAAPVERYQEARARGAAAVEQRYWDLVDRAFAALGADRRERYHATTPAPDVPVLSMRRRPR